MFPGGLLLFASAESRRQELVLALSAPSAASALPSTQEHRMGCGGRDLKIIQCPAAAVGRDSSCLAACCRPPPAWLSVLAGLAAVLLADLLKLWSSSFAGQGIASTLARPWLEPLLPGAALQLGREGRLGVSHLFLPSALVCGSDGS